MTYYVQTAKREQAHRQTAQRKAKVPDESRGKAFCKK